MTWPYLRTSHKCKSNLQQEALHPAELPAERTSALTLHLSDQAPANHTCQTNTLLLFVVVDTTSSSEGLGIPPGTHLWYQWKRKVNVQLSAPHYHNEDRLRRCNLANERLVRSCGGCVCTWVIKIIEWSLFLRRPPQQSTRHVGLDMNDGSHCLRTLLELEWQCKGDVQNYCIN